MPTRNRSDFHSLKQIIITGIETWKDIPKLKGFYQASNWGRIRSVTRKVRVRPRGRSWGWRLSPARVLKLNPCTSCGHLSVSISVNNKITTELVHRLVLETFIGPCPEGMQCRHLNGKAWDNRVENLAWGTNIEDREDMKRHGTMPMGERHHNAVFSENDIREIRRLYDEEGLSQSDIARLYGKRQGQIHPIVKRKCWIHVK